MYLHQVCSYLCRILELQTFISQQAKAEFLFEERNNCSNRDKDCSWDHSEVYSGSKKERKAIVGECSRKVSCASGEK